MNAPDFTGMGLIFSIAENLSCTLKKTPAEAGLF
jgi:hypothetical protein